MSQLLNSLFSGILYGRNNEQGIKEEAFSSFREDIVSRKKIKDIKEISNSINKESPESISKAIEDIAKFLDDNDSIVKSFALVTLLKIIVEISKSSKPGGAFESKDPKEIQKLLKTLTKLCKHKTIQDNTECRTAFESAIKNLSGALAKALLQEGDKFLSHDYFRSDRLSDKELEIIKRGLQTTTRNLLGGISKEQCLQTIQKTKEALIGNPLHIAKMHNGIALTVIGEA